MVAMLDLWERALEPYENAAKWLQRGRKASEWLQRGRKEPLLLALMAFGATTLLFASPTLMPMRPMVQSLSSLSSLASQLFFLQEAALAAAALIVDVLSGGLTTAKVAPAAGMPA